MNIFPMGLTAAYFLGTHFHRDVRSPGITHNWGIAPAVMAAFVYYRADCVCCLHGAEMEGSESINTMQSLEMFGKRAIPS